MLVEKTFSEETLMNRSSGRLNPTKSDRLLNPIFRSAIQQQD
jgi:hypothetical protein